MPKTRTYYRIVEMKDGAPHSLFHGTQGRRELPLNEWINADLKMVSDGGREYLSGFHLFKTHESAKTYLDTRFKHKHNKCVIVCYAKELWPKPTNPDNVLLAERIMIPAYEEDKGNL